MQKKYKTRFPVARIKRIMQIDEDVGKMTQTTPVLVSKAIELFMQSLIGKACVETRERNTKRMTVAHLKRSILSTEQFDFLKDLVQAIPDPTSETKEPETRSSRSPSSSPPYSGSSELTQTLVYLPRSQTYNTLPNLSKFSGPGGLSIMNPVSNLSTFAHLLPPPPDPVMPIDTPHTNFRRRGRPKVSPIKESSEDFKYMV